MNITDKTYFDEYIKVIGKDVKNLLNNFDFTIGNSDLGYQTQASAVYSSNIEGNTVDLNSFMNAKLSKDKFKPTKEIQEIEDLVSAYDFAQNNNLNEVNFLKSHQILSKQLLISGLRGKYRKDKVGVFGQSGLVYLAIEAELVGAEMKLFFTQISKLLLATITEEEVFYYAALIHLRFVHIHPFRDGNGRVARLLEKWFLSIKLGMDFWKIPSEKYYKDHQPEYYKNINLGVNFYELNYNKCLPFLIMLPNSLNRNNN
ncbi:Fic family protein [Pedobacter changchengzhani]|uniref:Fic family protein n=1 Tax=Pedobacter changchengzhani TaxID=2529274 RepID=A0A4R5MMT7_9SPHI|nr:Fic family protein [Pedobacter changchengzhani]TDG37071.1 Fic family protein [Pedobacter changchengzhani]